MPVCACVKLLITKLTTKFSSSAFADTLGYRCSQGRLETLILLSNKDL